MANPQHLDLLSQGVDIWNIWRQIFSNIEPDLSGANLSGGDFSEINLSGANLTETNFIWATLNRANLSEANLSKSHLSGAYLVEADLYGANLNKADLIKANLSKTNLFGANLFGANLNEANLHGANLMYAILNEADLIKANLSDANLSGSDLTHACLIKANLSRTKLSMIHFNNLDSDKVLISEAFPNTLHFITANLSEANLSEANLNKAELTEVYLGGANLNAANLIQADLSNANLNGASLVDADLSNAHLNGATLIRADFNGACLFKTELISANLNGATLVSTDLRGAILSNCSIYGISVWNVQLEDAIQHNLIITHPDEPYIAVDYLNVAQFIHLLIDNKDIHKVIDTITSKVVLILGRFTKERKEVLNAIRDELRNYNYLPIMFDFDPPHSRDLTQTVVILASLSQFIIADLTAPNSIGHELATIFPQLKNIPVQLLIEAKYQEYSMVETFASFSWLLSLLEYKEEEIEKLLAYVPNIIDMANQMREELALEKAKRQVKKLL